MFDIHLASTSDQNTDKAERTPRLVDFRLNENEIDKIVREIEDHTTRYYDRRFMYKLAHCIYTVFSYVFTAVNKV